MKKILLVATIIFSLNVCLFAQKQENFNHIGLYTMRIGKIEAIVISDGHLCVNPVQAEFAQRIDSVKVAKTLQEHFAPVTEVDLAMNILLLKIGNRYVLIDAGAGYVFGCESGWLAANLSYAGIQPDKVTDIIITHAHPDHIGGLTDKKGNLVFPNAEIISLVKNIIFGCLQLRFYPKHHDRQKTHENARGCSTKEHSFCNRQTAFVSKR